MIKRFTRNTFRAFISQARESPQMMWRKIKWVRKQLTKQICLSPLKDENKQEISEPELKANLLLRTFFPPPIQTDLTDITNSTPYPHAHIIESITTNEIRKTIEQAPPRKASEGDEIPNLILKETTDILLSHLHRIFNEYLTNDYYPNYFRTSITVILPKPKKNHFISKGYRFIALLNIIKKTMKFILAKRIAYLTKIYHLLSVTYMRDRRLRLCEHDIYYLLKRIY